MNEATAIVQAVHPYFEYLGAPLLIFSALAVADLMIDLVIRLVRRASKEYEI